MTAHGLSGDLLLAAEVVRRDVGRINDVIHATAISLALPHILDADEVLLRPSLEAGNDPSRPYDVETDRRIAEFKLGRWRGADAMRKRQLVKDLVHLAGDDSARTPQLFVVGSRPQQFLKMSNATVLWALRPLPSDPTTV